MDFGVYSSLTNTGTLWGTCRPQRKSVLKQLGNRPGAPQEGPQCIFITQNAFKQ